MRKLAIDFTWDGIPRRARFEELPDGGVLVDLGMGGDPERASPENAAAVWKAVDAMLGTGK